MTPISNPVVNYFRTSYEELSKVTWPTRQEAVRHGLVVIVFSLVTAAFFGVVDYLLSWGLERLVTR